MLEGRGIDWCEDNKPSTNFLGVEELYNTFTNGFYVIVALVLFFQNPNSNSTFNKLYGAFCFFVLMTGVTSGIFHATLTKRAQKADEFFENACLVSLYHLAGFIEGGEGGGGKRKVIAHCVVLAAGIVFVEELFCEVHLGVIILATFQRFISILGRMKLRKEKRYLIESCFVKGLGCVVIGFGGWVLDRAFCEHFGGFLLHASIWHSGTSLALLFAGIGVSELYQFGKVNRGE